jgi:arginine exporter protein ArgO
MKAAKGNERIVFIALCALTLISAVGFVFSQDADDDMRFRLAALCLLAPSALLIWSIAGFRKNLVRGTKGVLVLLVAGFMALTVMGWQIHNRIDDMVNVKKEIIWFQSRLK